MGLNKDLLDKLACPKCRGAVVLTPNGASLTCAACQLIYEIEDDIPTMIVELARPLGGESSPST